MGRRHAHRIVAGERNIPIAYYGTSNVGMMKRVYRNGLGVRYGQMMQAIAGIHWLFVAAGFLGSGLARGRLPGFATGLPD